MRKGEDVVHGLKLGLDDLYNGVTKKLSLSRNVICKKCDGKGSKSGAKRHVQRMQGRGRQGGCSTNRAGYGAADANGVQHVRRYGSDDQRKG